MNFIDTELDWDDGIERRLAALPVPSMPAELEALCRAAVATNRAAPGNTGTARRSRQFVLLGMAAVAAAAAAMLARQFLAGTDQAENVRSAVTQVEAVAPEGTPVVPGTAEQSAAATSQPAGKPVSPADRPKPFTVRVMPLQNEARSVTAQSSIELFHASFLRGLRAIPGLTLITPESTGVAEGAPAPYELEFRGSDSGAPDQWIVRITAKVTSPGSDSRTSAVVVPFMILGGGGESCADEGRTGERRTCGDPASMAAQWLDLARSVLFPQDPARKQQLQSRLQDRALDPAQRLRALEYLRMPELILPEDGRPARIQNAPLDDAMVQGTVDLISSADASVRASALRALRGTRSPVLVAPLVKSVRPDNSDEVRLLAVAMLAQDFVSDPEARAALQSAASDDPRQLVRMIAQKGVVGGVAGEGLWRNYIASTVGDASLTTAQRLEPLSYMSQSGQSLAEVLDDAVVDSLAPLFPSIWNRGMELDNLGRTLIGALQTSGNPVVVELCIEALRAAGTPMTRSAAVNVLAGKFRNDERARKALEAVARDDPDPGLRKKAAEALGDPMPVPQQ